MPAVKSQEDQLREIMMAAQPASGYQNTAKMLAGRRQPVRHWAEALGNFATGMSSHLNTQAAAQAEQQQALAKQRLAQMNRRDPVADAIRKEQAMAEFRAGQAGQLEGLTPQQRAAYQLTGNLPAARAPSGPEAEYNLAKQSGFTGSYLDFVKAKSGGAFGGSLPTSVKEFQFSQQNPEYADFLKTKKNPLVQISTPTAQKALLESVDKIQTNSAAIGNLDEMLKMNEKATYSGTLADERARVMSFTGDENAQATVNLDNMVKSNALQSLKATFGSMPTEGERKILIEVSGSVNQPPSVRKKIFQRARAAAIKRRKFEIAKAKALKDGSFFSIGAGGGVFDEFFKAEEQAAQGGGGSGAGEFEGWTIRRK